MTDRELAACPLLPCPFCGGEAKRDDRTEYQSYSASESQSMGMSVSAGGFSSTTYAIQCGCGIRVQGNNDAFLIERWNRRSEAALRLSDGEGWQPIETAPDEVPADDAVIVCITHDEPRFAGQRMVGEAYKVDGVWWWAGSHPNDYHSDPIEDMYGLGCVTHWQPLPAAPRHETGEW
jgi:hypothetical protein